MTLKRPYYILWKSGWMHSHCGEKTYETQGAAKRAASQQLRTHYLDYVAIAVQEDDGTFTPLLVKKCIHKDGRPYYGQWREAEKALP